MNTKAAPFPASPFKQGDRVKLVLPEEIFDVGVFPAGALGTVTEVTEAIEPCVPVGRVRLDEPFPHLDHWENTLQVWLPADGSITWDSFTLAGAA